jgi:chemotaxis regulatin CheY-phosphate phosphatase CheZ
MNPEVKKIGNKLFDKVELASQKVELGVVEDIAKMTSDANSLLRTLIDDKTLLSNADKAIATANANADKVAVNSEKNAQKALALLPKIGTILDKADQAAKGLGLDSKGITGYTDLDKLYFTLEAAQKEVGLGYKFQN